MSVELDFRLFNSLTGNSTTNHVQFTVYLLTATYGNDPSAGSPTETLLRLLLPLNDQV